MPTLLLRLRAAARGVRRAVLRRRRLLAALCALVAVWAGLRATAAPAPELVPVTVAAHDLGAGAVLGPGDLTTRGFAPGTVPSGHIRDPVGRQLAGPLRRGQPITDTALLGASLVRDRPDLVALPVRLPDTAMAELLRVGDEVDVISADPQGGPAATVARDGAGARAAATSGRRGRRRAARAAGGARRARRATSRPSHPPR